ALRTPLQALYLAGEQETGVEAAEVEHLEYAVHVEDRRRNDRAVSFAFKARYKGLLNPRDPDGFIVEARFFPAEEVRTIVPIPPLRDPLSTYLTDHVPGRFYTFAGWDGRNPRLV